MPVSAAEITKAGKSALDYYTSKKPLDQIGTDRPFLRKLVAKKKSFPGAKQYVIEKLITNYGSNFQWFYGNDTVTYNTRDPLADASFSWKAFHDGFQVNEHELRQNGITITDTKKAGAAPSSEEIKLIADYFDMQMEVLQAGVEAKLDMELHRSGAQSNNSPAGLDAIVSLTPTTGTLAGIDRSTSVYWRNHAATALTQSTMISKMDQAWRACSRNGGRPDFIMVGDAYLDVFRAAAASGNKQIVIQSGSGTAEGGLPEFTYQGVPVIWNPVFNDLDTLEAPATQWAKRCYFLNTKHLFLRDAEGDWMQSRTPARSSDAYVWKFGVTGTLALTTNRANAHAVLAIS